MGPDPSNAFQSEPEMLKCDQMSIFEKYELTRIINAHGTFTPLGVSRSPETVRSAVGEALADYFIIDELQQVASSKVAQWSGADAGTVLHCADAAITLSIAAVMTGVCQSKIASLPDTTGMRNRVVLPACHAVNYGHPVEQAIRLAGAKPVLVGTSKGCSQTDIDNDIAHADTCCVLLVSSRLVGGQPVDFKAVVKAAHFHGVPVIIDGAAQDMRIEQLLSTNADLVIVSAQKYLAAPTAGLAIGRQSMIDGVRAQEKGIGRAMKASKEAIIGVLAAIEEREKQDTPSWSRAQELKVIDFVQRANCLDGIKARTRSDPTGLPFARACLKIDHAPAGINAEKLVTELKSGKPSIWVMFDKTHDDEFTLELVQITPAEIDIILSRLAELLT